MLPGIRSLAVAMHLEIYWVYIALMTHYFNIIVPIYIEFHFSKILMKIIVKIGFIK